MIIVIKKLKPLLEDPSVKKIGQNIKFDFIVLDEYHLITPKNSETLSGRMLGLSGTHPVEEEKLDILKKLGLKICYKLSIYTKGKEF